MTLQLKNKSAVPARLIAVFAGSEDWLKCARALFRPCRNGSSAYFKEGNAWLLERIVQYGCKVCGRRIDVTRTGDIYEEPVYCCGLEAAEANIPAAPAAPAVKKKPAVRKKAGKKAAKKKAAKKAVKKKSAKKKATQRKKRPRRRQSRKPRQRTRRRRRKEDNMHDRLPRGFRIIRKPFFVRHGR
jgi:hypothetical protein